MLFPTKGKEWNEKHTMSRQGQVFIRWGGLLDLAHDLNLLSIETELVPELTDHEKSFYTFRAIAIAKRGNDIVRFVGYGEAYPANVANKMLHTCLIRMAETRAKCRALRDLTNCGVAAIEELDSDSFVVNENSTKPTSAPPKEDPLREADVDRITKYLAISGKQLEGWESWTHKQAHAYLESVAPEYLALVKAKREQEEQKAHLADM